MAWEMVASEPWVCRRLCENGAVLPLPAGPRRVRRRPDCDRRRADDRHGPQLMTIAVLGADTAVNGTPAGVADVMKAA